MVTLPNGTELTEVTRESCLARINAIPLGSYFYSQTTKADLTGKRADCTGWVSYVWATPDEPPEIPGVYLNAYNTASFYNERVIRRIDWSELLPGDMIGYCSPTSPGNGGHAAIWLAGDRRPSGRFHVRDHGSTWGPKDRWVQWDGQSTGWLHPDHLAPWRYVAMIEGDDMTPEQDALLFNASSISASFARMVDEAPIKKTSGPNVGQPDVLEMKNVKAIKAIQLSLTKLPDEIVAALPEGGSFTAVQKGQIASAVVAALTANPLAPQTHAQPEVLE